MSIEFSKYTNLKSAMLQLCRSGIVWCSTLSCWSLNPSGRNDLLTTAMPCRVGKGTHVGADQAQRMMQKVLRNHGVLYAFKADISKFFYSIDHEIMKSLIRKKISCKQLLTLIDDIIDSSGGGVGIPIRQPNITVICKHISA